MVIVHEVAGRPHIFNLPNGQVARIKAHGTLSLDESQIEGEILEAEKRNSIYIRRSPKKANDFAKKKEV